MNSFSITKWRPFFWISLVVVIIFFQSLSYKTTYLDDNVLIVDQFKFNQDLSNIPQAFREDIFRSAQGGGSYYRPILRLSFMLDAQFGGELMFLLSHTTNILLHILSGCLLYLLLRKLKNSKEVSFLLSILFAVHPIATQVVAWIPGRNDSLLAALIIPSFLFFVNFLEKQRLRDFFLHLLFLGLALFTKETAIVLPLVCLGYYLIFSNKSDRNSRSILYLPIGWLVFGGLWFYVRYSVLNAMVGSANYSIFKSLVTNSPAMIIAFGKSFLPVNLSVFPILRDMTLLYGLTSILLLFFLIKKYDNYNKTASFGLLWFFLFLLLSLIQPTGSANDFSEHRIYLPLIGIIILISGFFRNDVSNYRFHVRKCLILFAIVLLSLKTISHTRNFKNSLTFWTNAVKTSPTHAFNYNNLGAMYYLNNNLNAAEKYYKNAANINPNEPMVHNNLGLVYMKQGRFQKAEQEYKKEIINNPGYSGTYDNYGSMLRHFEYEAAYQELMIMQSNMSSKK